MVHAPRPTTARLVQAEARTPSESSAGVAGAHETGPSYTSFPGALARAGLETSGLEPAF